MGCKGSQVRILSPRPYFAKASYGGAKKIQIVVLCGVFYLVLLHVVFIVSAMCASSAIWRPTPFAHGSHMERRWPGRHVKELSLQNPVVRFVIVSLAYDFAIWVYFGGISSWLYAHICDIALVTFCSHSVICWGVLGVL